MIRAAPPSPAPRPAPRAMLLVADLGVPDGVGLAEGVVLAGFVVTCAGRVEDNDDEAVEEEEEEEREEKEEAEEEEGEVVAAEEDVVLLVTLKYSDANKGLPPPPLYIPSQKMLLRDKSKFRPGSPLHK